MSYLENNLLTQSDRISNPKFYVRYVDDIMAIFNSPNHVNYFLRRLKNNSVLNFTVEHMSGNKFNFLDVAMKIENERFISSVYCKPTDKGIYCNYFSFTADTYKRSVVKTLVFRALKYTTNWTDFHAEITRLKQLFANNDYPQQLVETIIQSAISKYLSKPKTMSNNVQLFLELINLQTFRADSQALTNILTKHISCCDPDSKLELKTYFKSKKLSSLFSTREKCEDTERSKVVYKFCCSEERCKASYIGYTTNTLSTRCRQHRYRSSSIYQHFTIDHCMLPPSYDVLVNNFSTIHQFSNTIDLKIAEALEIKKHMPFINVKFNEMSTILNLFV